MDHPLFGAFSFNNLRLPFSPKKQASAASLNRAAPGSTKAQEFSGRTGAPQSVPAPPPAAARSCGENLESAAPGPEHCACPMALLGCGSPAGLLQLRQWNPVPRRRSRGRGNSLRWLPPSGRTARTAEAPVALDALPAGSGGGGGGDGSACVTRDCRPSSGAAIFSSPGPQAKKGPGSGQTLIQSPPQPGPGPRPHLQSTGLQRG